MGSYRDLEVWELGRRLVADVYDITQHFPSTEAFGLTAQIRRAAVSIPSNIAEGAGRKTDASFAHFLRIASGSLNELETLLILAVDLGFLKESRHDEIVVRLRRLAIKVQNLIASIAPPALREAVSAYDFDEQVDPTTA